MASKVVLERATIIKPLAVSQAKIGDDIVYPFERQFQMELFTNVGNYLWTVEPGYVSNCGSIPWLGQKLLRVKSYDPKNPLQNAFFFLHDDLYQKKGYDIFSRDDSDALCRGGLREAGCSRFQASTIDFCLMIGACGHWGDNSYGNFDFLSKLEKVG
ncbi:hypothetical protein [Fibrobacter sp.]|uniref:hypothetical protein n=1 Tax=Fibrobacter sp. TaxID=35828 RepID=UPI00386DB821